MSKPLCIASVVDDSIVDGPGIRLTIFTQGCPRRCKACHNPELLPFEGGTTYTSDEIMKRVLANPLLDGITFSGGEPLCQAGMLLDIARRSRERGLSIWIYTGYSFEEVMDCKVDDGNNGQDAMELLRNSDVIVDGEFIEEHVSLDLKWKGSSNQRVIDIPKTLEKGDVVLHE